MLKPNFRKPNPGMTKPSLPVILRDLTQLHCRDGAMTRELLQQPSQFGLGMLPASLDATATTTSVCGYCSTGCRLQVHLGSEAAIGLTPEASYPVNHGSACPKGWEALRVLDATDRATTPLLRDSHGQLQPVAWEVALSTFCARMKGLQAQYGTESVAFLSTGQIPCEEMALLGALTKFGMGFQHGDGNTRQCMATAVSAYKESFGFDAPPYTYEDLELSDCLVFVGANPCLAHPILWERVLRNRRSPEIIVIDPRRTETAMAASLHLPLRPKSDLILLYGLAREILVQGYADTAFIANHTSGFDRLRQDVEEYDLDRVAQQTGLDKPVLQRAAESISSRGATSFWWTMGVNQSYQGTRTAQAIINLALLTGNIGRPGTGANSITGQCNAMGSRLWSNTTNLLGGHRFENPADRAKVAGILGIDVARIPTSPSWSYDRILDGIDRGEIRGLWVIATNPAHSWIHQPAARERLAKLEFLVVQDMYTTTETALAADLLLPAAGWGEKDGTFINSERRYGVIRKVRRAPGQALADFAIFQALAETWGCGDLFRRWTHPEAVFQILRELSAGQPCDITAIEGYAHLDRCGGIQWPWPDTPEHQGSAQDAPTSGSSEPRPAVSVPTHRRLFSDGRFYTPDGRARLVVDRIAADPEPTDAEYPFQLLTGRGSASQWHTQTRTSKSPVLRKLYPEQPYVEIHPADAQRLEITAGAWVEVSSRRGTARVVATLTRCIPVGQLFMPMHDVQTNQLTLAHFDPHSRQPSYKNCAVRVRPLPFGTSLKPSDK
jgi:anaerobic selenocysteine-containing dehydrogenase